jgi:hypothetical protein
LAVSKINYDKHSQDHKDLLLSVKDSFENCQWEKLGFQSEDHPENDVRNSGGGIFNLLQLRNLIKKDRKLATRLAIVSQQNVDPIKTFPFALTSFDVSVRCLKLVRNSTFSDFVIYLQKNYAI